MLASFGRHFVEFTILVEGAVRWNGGFSFGGVIAFLFADLIVLPILNNLSQILWAEDQRILLVMPQCH
jgi:hypothetical protein